MNLRSFRSPSPVRISNLLVAALACSVGAFVLGARWMVVSRYGMDLPEWDQWDAEGLHLLLPWFQGRPIGPELFAPHNEHYVVLTKLLNLGLTLANGVWDQRLECVVNALLPAGIAIAFLRWSRGFTPAAFTGFVGLFLAGAWGLPLAWHNVVSGFHSQQFFLIALSFSAIALLPFSRPWSLRWYLGAASAALALLSMGSGFFAAAVVIVLLLLRVLLREASFRNVWPALLLALALCGTGWLTRHEVDYHVVLRARNIQDFVLTVLRGLQWPAPGSPWLAALLWLPWTWLAVRLLFNREKTPVRIHGWTLFGLGLWVWLQLIATGYARGAGGPPPATRYLDTLVFGCTVNFLAIGWLRAQRLLSAPRRLALAAVGVAWLAVVAWGVFTETRQALTDHLPAIGHAHRNAIVQTRAYLATGDQAFLDHPDIPYPEAAAFAERLAHPELVNLLPASVRPSETHRPGSGNGNGAARTTETPWLSRAASLLGALGQPVAMTAFVALVLLAAACWRVSPREPLHLAATLCSIRQKFFDVPRSSKVTTLLLVLSAFGIVLGFVSAREAAVRPLPADDPGITSTIGDGSWRADTLVPVDAPPSMRRLAVRGSYVDGDTFTGEHVTGWYRADSPVSLMVIGYPRRSPNQLTVEVRLRDGTIADIPFNGENPAERWAEWACDIPANAEALRVRGIDATTVWGGWLGFSEPFARSQAQTLGWGMAAKTLCTVVLALVLVIGPGLVWRRWRKSGLMSLLWVGPTWLVIGGSTCWALGGVMMPATVGFIWTTGTLLGVGWYAYREHLWETCTLLEKRVLLLVALCVLGATAKAAFSGGPRTRNTTSPFSRSEPAVHLGLRKPPPLPPWFTPARTSASTVRTPSSSTAASRAGSVRCSSRRKSDPCSAPARRGSAASTAPHQTAG